MKEWSVGLCSSLSKAGTIHPRLGGFEMASMDYFRVSVSKVVYDVVGCLVDHAKGGGRRTVLERLKCSSSSQTLSAAPMSA